MDADKEGSKEGSGYSHYRSSLECGGQEIANADYYPDKLLINKNINKNKLSHLQKILLMTDGTVTELLEHLSREPIVIEKLYQAIINNHDEVPASHAPGVYQSEGPVLIRKIILKGKHTDKNYIYAESTILIDRLPECFRNELIDSKIPIGKLWSKHKLETYKTDFSAESENSNVEISGYLSVPVDSELLSRTYSVYSCGEKSMIITEKFSSSLFVS